MPNYKKSDAPPLGIVIAEQASLCIRTALVVGGGIFATYCLKEILIAMAGTNTHADVFISFLGDVNVSVWLAWGLAGGGVIYGESQRRLRYKEIENSHSHIEQLERAADRRRTSSGLTKKGTTHPKDR